MAERISEGEQAVMEALWSAAAPLTAAEVHAAIADRQGWSESTVKTMLGRLVAKRALSTEEDGRRFRYRPAVAREQFVARESSRLIDRLFGGRSAALVAHLAGQDRISAEDAAEIEALLRELKR